MTLSRCANSSVYIHTQAGAQVPLGSAMAGAAAVVGALRNGGGVRLEEAEGAVEQVRSGRVLDVSMERT